MKLNINVFLMKEEVIRSEILSENANPNHINFTYMDKEYDFYWRISTNQPRWATLFTDVPEIDTESMFGRGVQGLLVLEFEEKIFCFTFGHARHFINQSNIERYFGLKTALSLSDPTLIKQIDKSTIDKTPLRHRSQASKYISMSEFEFKFDWEILKSLTGVVEGNDNDYEVVSGSDSVSLYTEVELHQIPVITERLKNAYEDESYKEKYRWIGRIVPVRDKTLLSNLDDFLVSQINANSGDFWIGPPKIMEYENFSGFCYQARRKSTSSLPSHPDLDLRRCLIEKDLEGELSNSIIKSTKIHVLNSGDEIIDQWSLYSCLNGEVEYNNHLYLLSDGDWYQIDRDFCSEINSYFENFDHSNIDFPNYNSQHEGDYLIRVADNNEFFLMDRKLVRPNGAMSSIEFCDLITSEHHLIHVKKYSSSSVLSHLFSQAYVSAESLLRSPEIIDQVNQKLSIQTNHSFEFDSTQYPRTNKIIIAIMQKRSGGLHMPFFSKVNFKQYSEKLGDMGFTVELAKISI